MCDFFSWVVDYLKIPSILLITFQYYYIIFILYSYLNHYFQLIYDYFFHYDDEDNYVNYYSKLLISIICAILSTVLSMLFIIIDS